jgi:hypothetical protein
MYLVGVKVGLKHMLTKAVEWEMVHEGVLQKIRKVKMISEQNQRLRFLSEEECQAVVNACSQHLKPIVITALHTGMRKEEILSSTVVFWVARGNRHLAITIDCLANNEVKRSSAHCPSSRHLWAYRINPSISACAC